MVTSLFLGRAIAFSSDYSQAKASAARILHLFKRRPLIDSTSTDGVQPVSCNVIIVLHSLEVPSATHTLSFSLLPRTLPLVKYLLTVSSSTILPVLRCKCCRV